MNKKDKKILIVDDDKEICDILKGYIADFAKTYIAYSGKEAMKILAKEKNINLMLIDIKMPQMDGIELLRIVKAKYPRIIAIMLTAFGPKAGKWEYVDKCKKIGIYTFIEKPGVSGILVPIINRALEDGPARAKLIEKYNRSIRNSKKSRKSITITPTNKILNELGDKIAELPNDYDNITIDMRYITSISEVATSYLISVFNNASLILTNVKAIVKDTIAIYSQNMKIVYK